VSTPSRRRAEVLERAAVVDARAQPLSQRYGILILEAVAIVRELRVTSAHHLLWPLLDDVVASGIQEKIVR
jgi:hypothetical protein